MIDKNPEQHIEVENKENKEDKSFIENERESENEDVEKSNVDDKIVKPKINLAISKKGWYFISALAGIIVMTIIVILVLKFNNKSTETTTTNDTGVNITTTSAPAETNTQVSQDEASGLNLTSEASENLEGQGSNPMGTGTNQYFSSSSNIYTSYGTNISTNNQNATNNPTSAGVAPKKEIANSNVVENTGETSTAIGSNTNFGGQSEVGVNNGLNTQANAPLNSNATHTTNSNSTSNNSSNTNQVLANENSVVVEKEAPKKRALSYDVVDKTNNSNSSNNSVNKVSTNNNSNVVNFNGQLSNASSTNTNTTITSANDSNQTILDLVNNNGEQNVSRDINTIKSTTNSSNQTALSYNNNVARQDGYAMSYDSNAISLQKYYNKFTLFAGTYIPLITTSYIETDNVGVFSAVVRENVYDSVTGRYLIIPMGSKILGTYDGIKSENDTKIIMSVDRLILPNGAYMNFEKFNVTDMQGTVGASGDVNWRYLQRFGKGIFALATTILDSYVSNASIGTGGYSLGEANYNWRGQRIDVAKDSPQSNGSKILISQYDNGVFIRDNHSFDGLFIEMPRAESNNFINNVNTNGTNSALLSLLSNALLGNGMGNLASNLLGVSNSGLGGLLGNNLSNTLSDPTRLAELAAKLKEQDINAKRSALGTNNILANPKASFTEFIRAYNSVPQNISLKVGTKLNMYIAKDLTFENYTKVR